MRLMSRSANLFFFQVLGVGLAILAVIFFLAVKFYPTWLMLWGSLAQKMTMICGCTNHWHFSNHPFIFSFFIGASLAALILFCFVLFKIGKMIWQTDRFVRKNLKKREKRLSFKLKKIGRQIG